MCDTPALQPNLGQENIQHTSRQIEPPPTRFRIFWRKRAAPRLGLPAHIVSLYQEAYSYIDLGEAPMDRMVARLNVEHFRDLLKRETDERERERLKRMLAEEEEKLRQAELSHRKSN